MDLSQVTLEIFSKLEQKWLYDCESGKKTRVLSIDGGGTDAIVSGEALVHLEDQIRRKTGDPDAMIVDFFDVVTGTGIGAILAAMITADGGAGRPLFSAAEAVGYLEKRRSEMFRVVGNGIFRQRKRCSGKSFELALKEALKKTDGQPLTLRDTCKPLLVPCFDLNSSAPFVFSRADATESPSYDFDLWKVCRATSATPGFFKPFPLTSTDRKTSCLAVDGGLVMNNPTAAAVTHVMHNKRDFPNVSGVEDLLVLSLGNGQLCNNPANRAVGKSSRLRQCDTSRVLNIVLDGVSDTVDQMLGNAFCWNRSDYVRIQGKMTERGVETLPFGGKRLLSASNGERVESFVQRLVASGKTSLPPSPCKVTAVSPLADGR
uniref:Patatin n=1 Tax=Kalanchoe fedtschenkoi TaxID=63787 RepID=A0A7N0ZQH5_KALFE